MRSQTIIRTINTISHSIGASFIVALQDFLQPDQALLPPLLSSHAWNLVEHCRTTCLFLDNVLLVVSMSMVFSTLAVPHVFAVLPAVEDASLKKASCNIVKCQSSTNQPNAPYLLHASLLQVSRSECVCFYTQACILTVASVLFALCSVKHCLLLPGFAFPSHQRLIPHHVWNNYSVR